MTPIDEFGFPRETMGPPNARDRLGRELHVGDEVLLVMPATLYRVVNITPLLHPGSPPNMVQVKLLAFTDINITRNGVIGQAVLTRLAAELPPVMVSEQSK